MLCYFYVELCLPVVFVFFLCLVYPMLPMSLVCPFFSLMFEDVVNHIFECDNISLVAYVDTVQ
jgi:hypothetical protein